MTKQFKKSKYSYFDIVICKLCVSYLHAAEVEVAHKHFCFVFLADIVIVINGCTVIFEVIMASNESPSERDFSGMHWFSHVFTASKWFYFCKE